jgi:exonuclease III
MRLTLWNCRGFSSRIKEEALKYIIRTSKSEILLIQETKMVEQDFLNTTKSLGKTSKGIEKIARGTSGGIGTLWYPMKFISLNMKHASIGSIPAFFTKKRADR